MRNLFLLIFIIFFVSGLKAQTNNFNLQIEITEVCGYGASDGGVEDYRWMFKAREKSTDSYINEGRMGYENMNAGTCLSYNGVNTTIGVKLPYKVWNKNYDYNSIESINIEIFAEGHEKDCGGDLTYEEVCGCNSLGFNCHDDDDYRTYNIPRPFYFNVSYNPGPWMYSKSIPIDESDTKYSFIYRWRWTPPVPNVPTLPNTTGSVNNICSGEPFTIETQDFSSKYTVVQYRWFENLDNEQEVIGYQPVTDYDCINWVNTNCSSCGGMDPPVVNRSSDDVIVSAIQPPPNGDCDPYWCDMNRCYYDEPIYGPKWTDIGTTTTPSKEVTAPISTTYKREVRYSVEVMGAEGVKSISKSVASAKMFVYPEAPSLDDYPYEIDNDTPENSVNQSIQDYTNIADTLSYGNLESIEILNVDCKSASTGKIRIKKVTGSGKYYYNLKNLNNNQVFNINGADLPNNGDPGTGGGGAGTGDGGPIDPAAKVNNNLEPTGIIIIDPIDPIDPGPSPEPQSDYIIFPDNANNATTDGLPAGTYLLRIENLESEYELDTSGNPVPNNDGDLVRMCYRTYVINIMEPFKTISVEEVKFSNNNDYAVKCYDEGNGEATITGSGGIGDYHFYLFKSDNSSDTLQFHTSSYKVSHKFSGLQNWNKSGADYKVNIEDELGCSFTELEINISEPTALSINSIEKSDYSSKNISCFGGADGKIGLKAKGGAGDYTYRLFEKNANGNYVLKDSKSVIDDETKDDDDIIIEFPINGDNQFPIVAGDYKVVMQDANLCQVEELNIIMTEPDSLDIVIVNNEIMHPLCIGGEDGYVVLTGVGGVPNNSNQYKIAKTEAALADATFSDKTTLAKYTSGIQTVWVMDLNGCTYSKEVKIPVNTSPLTIVEFGTQMPPSCSGHEDGSFNVRASNALGSPKNVSYHLYDNTNSLIETINNVTNLTQTFTGLRDGFYNVSVTDNNTAERCIAQVLNIELLNRPDPLQLSVFSIQEPSCNGFNDGVITYLAEGGDAPYQFSLDGENYFDDIDNDGLYDYANLSANLSSGYTVYVRDVNYTDTYPSSCVASVSQMLDEPTFVTITESIKDVSCFEGVDGEIFINISGGTPSSGYTYEWVDLSNSDILGVEENLAALSAGSYRVKVKNGDCPPKFESFTISEPSELRFQYVIPSPTSCEGRSDGFVTAGASGGTPPYQYTVDGLIRSVGFFTDLSIGTHQIELTDKQGCIALQDFNIETGVISLGIESQVNPGCFQSADGKIVLTASGGSSPYSYTINGSDYFSNRTFLNLDAGDYQLNVKDATGCTSEVVEISITEPDQLVIDPKVERDAYCDLSNGVASINIIGGTPDVNGQYNTIWLDNNMQTVAPDALKTGNYTVEVTDVNNCMATANVFIDNLPPHSLSYEVLELPYCGKSIGSARVLVSGGVGPFEYQWESQGIFSPEATSLKSGTYQVNVIDQYTDCQQMIEVVLTDGAPIVASQNVISATCGQDNGEATIIASGGVAPYAYEWLDNGHLLPGRDQLLAGVYKIRITDAVGCDLLYDVFINNDDGPSIVDYNATSSWCGLPTGTASVSLTDGTPPYNYQWITTSPVQTTSKAANLSAGEHIVVITDATGCLITKSILIEDDLSVVPEIEIVDIINSACELSIGSATGQMSGGLPPYTYLWNDSRGTSSAIVTDLSAGSYLVTGTDAKGCQVSMTVEIQDVPDPVLTFIAKTRSACGLALGSAEVMASGGLSPYIFYWNDPDAQTSVIAENLKSGSYLVFAEDANGCTTNTLQIQINDNPSIDLSITNIIPASCFENKDGSARINIKNGVAPYTVEWNDENNQEGELIELVGAGSYTATVTDSNGCSKQIEVDISAPNSISILNAISIQPDCFAGCNGSIQVFPSGGVGSYSFSWDNNQTSNTATNLCAGNYTVTIMDGNGCSYSEIMRLDQPVEITDTGMPEHEILCEGQFITLDPGINWFGHKWESENGFSSEESSITISEQGYYYLSALTEKGCLVKDTFLLENREDILDVQFLMSTEAEVGDTVVIVEITWPEPESISWEIPKEAREIGSASFYKELVFDSEGIYEIGLNASIGECRDFYSKSIRIFGQGELRTNGRVASSELIKSFMLYPNPNDGNFSITVLLSEKIDIEISIVSLQNGFIESRFTGRNSEEYSAEFYLPNLAKGVYLANLNAGKKEKNIRFVVK